MFNKKIISAVLLSFIIFADVCHAQADITKAFVFLSVFCEQSDSYYEQSADIVKGFDSYYEHFSFECTEPLTIPVSKDIRDSLWDMEKYKIQLFKIDNPYSPAYYLLRLFPCDTYLFSFREGLWIRICGYRESDLKVFFDALKKRGVEMDEITEMVELWRASDGMFREIDWDCLMEGYQNNNTNSDCYISGSNYWYKARYLGEKDDIYAVFSKKLLAGMLKKID